MEFAFCDSPPIPPSKFSLLKISECTNSPWAGRNHEGIYLNLSISNLSSATEGSFESRAVEPQALDGSAPVSASAGSSQTDSDPPAQAPTDVSVSQASASDVSVAASLRLGAGTDVEEIAGVSAWRKSARLQSARECVGDRWNECVRAFAKLRT